MFVCGAKSELFVPVIEIPIMLRGVPPVLVSVTVCMALVVATCWLPNAKVLGEKDATGDWAEASPMATTPKTAKVPIKWASNRE